MPPDTKETPGPRILLVPDLPLENWPSMDRYASRILKYLRTEHDDLAVRIAGPISELTADASAAHGRTHPEMARGKTWLTREARRYACRYFTYPRKVRRMSSDLVHILDHSYAHILHGMQGRPAVVSVHDLMPVMTVGFDTSSFTANIRNHFLWRVLKGIKAADAWIVFTERVKSELSHWLGRDDGIHVIPHGVDEVFFEPDNPEVRQRTREKWRLPADAFVVLHVGSSDERKNLPVVIKAVAKLRASGFGAWLLQVGAKLTGEQVKTLKRAGLDQCSVFLGSMPERELHHAYRAADVLCFPSSYEGFGLPVLEAMAAGVPVVSSGAGGLRDVHGDTGIIVPSENPDLFSVELERIALNPALRKELSEKGVARASQFTWSRAAARTADVYRSLIS